MPNRLMPESKHAIVVCTSDHLAQLDSLRATYPLTLEALQPLHSSSKREHEAFMRQSRASQPTRPGHDERAPRALDLVCEGVGLVV